MIVKGSNSAVIAGLNFIATDSKTRAGCKGGMVVSMSLGGARSLAVNSATNDVTSSGIFIAVAAGNDGQDASAVSPASEPTAFTVGATNSSDGLASFSNYGTSVDILTPGVSVLSTWPNSSTVSNLILPRHVLSLILNNRILSRAHLWLLHTLLGLLPTFSA
jgi:subtilisin family serine protease